MMSRTDKPASPKQLTYLRDLAQQTGTSFTLPKSSTEAKAEIDRLLRLKGTSVPPIEDAKSEADPTYAPAVRDDEISGYGSSAHWRGSDTVADDPLCLCGHPLSKHESTGGKTSCTADDRADRDATPSYCQCAGFRDRPSVTTGAGIEVGCYTLGCEHRILSARPDGSSTRFTDHAAHPTGDSFTWLETDLERDGAGAVAAVARSYVAEAHERQAIPAPQPKC